MLNRDELLRQSNEAQNFFPRGDCVRSPYDFGRSPSHELGRISYNAIEPPNS